MRPPRDELIHKDFMLEVTHGRVHVHVYGHGPELLVAWHGYGFDGSAYASWAASWGEHYTICAPDLPFHGRTKWTTREFTPSDIQEIMAGILQRQATARFSLIGHSLGARLIICNVLAWAEACDRFVLLAPAGIGSFDRVKPRWMQDIAEGALRWTSALRLVVNLGHRLGIVSNFHRRYAEVQLYPPEIRNRLFRVYNSLRHLQTTRPDRQQFWAATAIPTLVVLAKQDRFVPNAAIRTYFSINEQMEMVEVEGGHEMVNERVAEKVKQLIASS